MAPIGITRYPLSGKARFCIAPRDMPGHFSLCRMITNLVSVTRKLSLRVLSSCVPKDKSKPLAIRFWRTAGFEPAKSELNRLIRSKDSSGIHFGISWCTAVKDQLKHWLEATFQAYFTNPQTVFHGKKAANSYLSPQLNCFSSFSMTNFRKGSGSKTSTIGPKERIRITISDSSS